MPPGCHEKSVQIGRGAKKTQERFHDKEKRTKKLEIIAKLLSTACGVCVVRYE